LSEWNKDLAPSKELRIWYHHNPALWEDFSKKYKDELKHTNYGREFLTRNKQQEIITLLYASHDTLHTHALVLKEYLQEILQQHTNNNR
jgi:Uncharacterized conserved protein